MKVTRYPSEMNVLWEIVVIEGDSQEEVQAEVTRVMEESGNATFHHPKYRKTDGKWVSVGEAQRSTEQ